ncbi:alternate signal-mediated exported protein [Georgenia soli]|uniref:Alternate signal-mediated exported protein n=1 Tax=Georgenia soli TaxID=638953 RepID=A0A2A9EQA0_9MICO|nr:alternate-type signal peptide domain-containing protein [Georgenia soli]PFG40442.1 alternate signal-mediated exported protein [Georgenia soli]
MNNKTKGALAGVAGVAILAGGTTFALWSDSDKVDGGEITSGNLDVAALGGDWYDTSADRADRDTTVPFSGVSAHKITSIGSYRVVPEDTLQMVQGLDIGLEGDNLQASLKVVVPAALDANDGVELSYEVFRDGVVVQPSKALGSAFDMRIQAGQSGQDQGDPDPGVLVIDEIDTDGVADLGVVITAKFLDQDDQDLVTTTLADLADITVELKQVRDGSGFKTN